MLRKRLMMRMIVFLLIFLSAHTHVNAIADLEEINTNFKNLSSVLAAYKERIGTLMGHVILGVKTERAAMQARIDAYEKAGGQAKVGAQIVAHDLRAALVGFVDAVQAPLTSLGRASLKSDEQTTKLLGLFSFKEIPNWQTIKGLKESSEAGGTTGAEQLNIDVVQKVFANLQKSIEMASSAAQTSITELTENLRLSRQSLEEANRQLTSLQKEKGKEVAPVEARELNLGDAPKLADLFDAVIAAGAGIAGGNAEKQQREAAWQLHSSQELKDALAALRASSLSATEKSSLQPFADALDAFASSKTKTDKTVTTIADFKAAFARLSESIKTLRGAPGSEKWKYQKAGSVPEPEAPAASSLSGKKLSELQKILDDLLNNPKARKKMADDLAVPDGPLDTALAQVTKKMGKTGAAYSKAKAYVDAVKKFSEFGKDEDWSKIRGLPLLPTTV